MHYTLALVLCLFSFSAFAACPDPQPENSFCLRWTAPTQNVDGSPLTDLAGFRVYWAFDTGDYSALRSIEVPDATQTDLFTDAAGISVPSPGPAGGDVEVFFVVTAFDDDRNESDRSGEVSKAITFPDTLPPAPPQIIEVLINFTVQ